MLVQTLDQVFRVCMVWVNSQGSFHISETLLEISPLIVQVRNVIQWFEEECSQASTLLEVVPCLLNVSFA